MHFSFQQKMVIVGLLALVFLMIFFISLSFYRNQQINAQIHNFEQENARLQTDLKKFDDEYQYFSSPNYQDKYAKEMLNKLNPGEKVIVITDPDLKAMKVSAFLENAVSPSKAYKVWKNYFFKDLNFFRLLH